jgi:hypothetical protein
LALLKQLATGGIVDECNRKGWFSLLRSRSVISISCELDEIEKKYIKSSDLFGIETHLILFNLRELRAKRTSFNSLKGVRT